MYNGIRIGSVRASHVSTVIPLAMAVVVLRDPSREEFGLSSALHIEIDHNASQYPKQPISDKLVSGILQYYTGKVCSKSL